MSSSGRSRNNVDTRLIGFPPRTTMRGGIDIAILHQLYLRLRPGQVLHRHKPHRLVFNHEKHKGTKKNQPLTSGNQVENGKILQNEGFSLDGRIANLVQIRIDKACARAEPALGVAEGANAKGRIPVDFGPLAWEIFVDFR